jgi:hypothetical protein
MNALAPATKAAKRAKNESRGAGNNTQIVLAELAGGIAALPDLERHFASRCADLP